MRIYITGLPSGYQVEHLARVFFPGAQLLVEKPDGKDRGDLIRAHCGKKHHWAALRQNGRVYTRREPRLADDPRPDYTLAVFSSKYNFLSVYLH